MSDTRAVSKQSRRVSYSCFHLPEGREEEASGDNPRESSGSMAVAASSFDAWLSKKLQALNTDEGVFGTYIKGILESDEPEDEKTEALESILAGITVSGYYADDLQVRMRAVASSSRSKIDARSFRKYAFLARTRTSPAILIRARVFYDSSSSRDILY